MQPTVVSSERENKHWAEYKDNVQNMIQRMLAEKLFLLEEKKRIEESLSIIDMDLDDFKGGRLDRIVDRQRIDQKAIKVSKFKIEEVPDNHPRPSKWYTVYRLALDPSDQNGKPSVLIEVTNSAAKDFSAGSYRVGPNKEVIHFRQNA